MVWAWQYTSISTHTLARRVTEAAYMYVGYDEISTHTLARRVTDASCRRFDLGYISTHTLARRVTVNSGEDDFVQKIFQPTPSHGG